MLYTTLEEISNRVKMILTKAMIHIKVKTSFILMYLMGVFNLFFIFALIMHITTIQNEAMKNDGLYEGIYRQDEG